MRRSASLQGISAPTLRPDPKAPHPRGDPLPFRMAARRYSSRQLPTPPPAQEPSEVALLRTQNASLRAENDRLRRELAALSVRPPAGSTQTEEKVCAYREMIRNKFTSRAKASRITTECQTALLSSKEASFEGSRPALDQLYENYLNSRLPALEDLAEIAQRFFQDYANNYAKIKVLLATLNTNHNRPDYQKLKDMMELYKVPLLYQKSPQMLFRELSRSKEKPKTKKEKEKEGKEELCMEVLSPQETVAKFEGFLQKLCRSSQMVRMLRNNEHVVKFIAKIESARH